MDDEEVSQISKGGIDIASFSGGHYLGRRTGVQRGVLRSDILPYLSTYTLFKTAKRPKLYNPYFTRMIRKDIQ